MEIVQTFETTVADRFGGNAVRFLVVPQRSLAAAVRHGDPAPLAALESALDLAGLRHISASALPQAILGLLRADTAEPEMQEALAQAVLDKVLQAASPPPPATPVTPDPEQAAFAEHVAFAALVPIEESPITLVSLASKAAALSKNGVALGAFVGVVAGGTTPLLLLTVPAGIILCASAIAFAKVVDAKRGDIFAALLGVGGERPAPEDAPPSRQRRR